MESNEEVHLMSDVNQLSGLDLSATFLQPGVQQAGAQSGVLAEGFFKEMQDAAQEISLIRRIGSPTRIDDPVGCASCEDLDPTLDEVVEEMASGLAVAAGTGAHGLMIKADDV